MSDAPKKTPPSPGLIIGMAFAVFLLLILIGYGVAVGLPAIGEGVRGLLQNLGAGMATFSAQMSNAKQGIFMLILFFLAAVAALALGIRMIMAARKKD